MKRTTESLSASPLFFDALSGEFNPTGTDGAPLHTLGRLMAASFIKGKLVEVDEQGVNHGLVAVEYTPSWAQNISVLSRARLGYNDLGRPSAYLFSLLLSQNGTNYLGVTEKISPDGVGSHTIAVAGTEAGLYEAELNLDNATQSRDHATYAAQQYFDRLRL